MQTLKKISGFLCCLSTLMLSACAGDDNSSEAESCLEFLYQYMTTDDDLLHTRDFWEDNVRKTLEVKELMSWDIPDREFRYFVLPLRAYTEQVDDFRTTYADTLCKRIAGLSMAEAAVEVNYWCLEQVDFGPSQASSPMGYLADGHGDCNQLSEILVCALRAAGIPARVVTVVWAHKSGSHAWVEAWADGKWHYMGGSEPAPSVDFAWFYKDAPCCMFAPILVFGDYDGPETVIGKTKGFTMISNLQRYAPVKNLKVCIRDVDGRSVPGAKVSFLVGKQGKRMPFHVATADSKGTVVIETGLGDCAVAAINDKIYGAVKVNAQDTVSTVVLNLNRDDAHSIIENMELAPPPTAIVPGTPECYQMWLSGDARKTTADSIRIATHSN